MNGKGLLFWCIVLAAGWLAVGQSLAAVRLDLDRARITEGDLAAVAKANEICNKYGMDTISCGATIACAMELNQRGALAGELAFGRADLLQTPTKARAADGLQKKTISSGEQGSAGRSRAETGSVS